MFNVENAILCGNRSLKDYFEFLMANHLSGAPVLTYPPLEGFDDAFGYAVDKTKKDLNKALSETETGIRFVLKEVLREDYGVSEDLIKDPFFSVLKLALGYERKCLPEYDNIPHIVPLDWATIAEFAKDPEEKRKAVPLFKRELKKLPIPIVTKEDEFDPVFIGVSSACGDLCYMAAFLSGYSLFGKSNASSTETKRLFDIYGSTVQPEQKAAFEFAFAQIKAEKQRYLESIGIPVLSIKENDNTIGLEEYDYPAYADIIETPIPIDWIRIAKETQELVLNLSKENEREKE